MDTEDRQVPGTRTADSAPGGEWSLRRLRQDLPPHGLFADREWLFSPEPLALPRALAGELERLGHRLVRFQEACDVVHRRSRRGSLPRWIAGYVDAGKPPWLLDHAEAPLIRNQRPRVIRPDLLWLGGNDVAMTEIDGVPGGIGLTAWLHEAYAGAGGFDLVGGRDGMRSGFASIVGGGAGADLAVSRESADYRPEMEWLAARLDGDWRVVDAESADPAAGRTVYRFFELFDHANLPALPRLLERAEAGEITITAPLRPHLEEKLWAALFWMRPLEAVWRHALRGNHLEALRRMIPYSWVVDPAPIPHHAVIPRLGLSDWRELGRLSQSERRLVLKVSGFSELAWGSRGVHVGHDLPADAWTAAVESALDAFPDQPYLLQEFRESARIRHPYWDPDTGERRLMDGRARLCPYYFVGAADGRARLGGVLATIVPADKKVIHGMRDGILVPCTVADE